VSWQQAGTASHPFALVLLRPLPVADVISHPAGPDPKARLKPDPDLRRRIRLRRLSSMAAFSTLQLGVIEQSGGSRYTTGPRAAGRTPGRGPMALDLRPGPFEDSRNFFHLQIEGGDLPRRARGGRLAGGGARR